MTLRFNLKCYKMVKYHQLYKICCYSSLLSLNWEWKLHPLSFLFLPVRVGIHTGSIFLSTFRWFTALKTSNTSQKANAWRIQMLPINNILQFMQVIFQNWSTTVKELRSKVFVSIRTAPLLAIILISFTRIPHRLPPRVQGWRLVHVDS